MTGENATTQVHLWWCSLDLPRTSVTDAYALLADDEIDRARKYKFTRDRHRFVAARSFLRRTIAEYLSVSPVELSFVYGAFGKPRLSPHPDCATVEFNLAHSGDIAMLAITHGVAVGVDVERMIQMSDLQGMALRSFSAYENVALSKIPEDLREFAFYCCWTRKEALLKALGDGLALPLDSFDVSLDERRARLVAARGERLASTKWTLFHLRPARGYVAALAVEGSHAQLVWRVPMTAGCETPETARF